MKRNACGWAALAGLAAIGLSGCGGAPLGTGGLTPVTPVSVSINPGEQKLFRAHAYGRITSVQWELVEGPTAGTLEPFTSLGRFYVKYTAPATPGTYWIKATINTSGPNPQSGQAQIVVVPK